MGLRNKILTVSRYGGGSHVDGYWTGEAVTSTFDIRCSLQPLRASEMDALPEGRRNLQSYKLFTSIQLNGVTSQNPDRVTIGGVVFEVFICNPWQNQILNHFRAIIQKRERAV